MIEYKVRAIETGGTGEVKKVCHNAAEDGWRLLSTNVENVGPLRTSVWLFFDGETGEPETQDTWRAQRGGKDGG